MSAKDRRSNVFVWGLLIIGIAALTGIGIDFRPAVLLVLHLAFGLMAFLFGVIFLYGHWWQRRQTLNVSIESVTGLSLAFLLIGLNLSGLLLLVWTNVPALSILHSVFTYLFMGSAILHIGWRLRFRTLAWLVHRPVPVRLLAGLAASAACLLIVGWSPNAAGSPAAEGIPIEHASLLVTPYEQKLSLSQDCSTCHSDLVRQWSQSAHASSARDEYYQAVTALLVREQGVETAQLCARCHSPLALGLGEVSERFLAAGESTGGAPAYQARSAGRRFELSPAAAEGVTCIVCHQAVNVDPTLPSGKLWLLGEPPALPGSPLARLVLRVAPENHAATFSPDPLQDPALCGSCHNLYSADGSLALEPTYDEWLASSYAEEGKTCQDCHFQPVDGTRADSSAFGPVSIHGGLPGAPSSLPEMASKTDLLRQSASLEVEVLSSIAGSYAIRLAVTNDGAGHYLPTGANDLRQLWLELRLFDASGQLVWQHGGLDAYGEYVSETIRFGEVLGDAQGRPITLHRIWTATQVLEDTRLAPGETRSNDFSIPLLSGAPMPVRLEIRLLYRDVSQAFAEFALERPVPDLAIFEIDRLDIDIPATRNP